MDEKTFRNKVSWLTFFFSLLVIWIHSYNIELFADMASPAGPVWDFAAWVENAVAHALGQIAVPGFFMLSSYLFFRNFSWEKLGEKWRSRAESILIPYVVWNILYYLGYVVATRLPGIRAVVGKEEVLFRLTELFNAVFHYRYGPIFWYLYQLILLIALSPLIYILVKKRPVGRGFLVILAAAAALGADMEHPNTDALFYYSAAAYLAVHRQEIVERRSGRLQLYLGVFFLALAVFFYGVMSWGTAALVIVGGTVLFRLSAPCALWNLIPGERLPKARPFMCQSLFLYAIHYIVVRFVNKGAALFCRRILFGNGLAAAALILYLLMPAIVAGISYGIALFLSRWCKPAWRVLSGGRSLPRE